jgi:hypothetical protein
MLFAVGVFGFRQCLFTAHFQVSEVVATGVGGGDFLSLAFRLLLCG